jgi:hypothetical protein
MVKGIKPFLYTILFAVSAMLLVDTIHTGNFFDVIRSFPPYTAAVSIITVVVWLPVLFILSKLRLQNIIYFALAGGAVAAISIIQFIGLWGVALDVLGNILLQYWELLLVGMLTGTFYWLVGVSKLTTS